MPKKRQALVEFEDMGGSSNAVTYANSNQIYIGGRPSYINYSTSQKISRPSDSDDTRSVNNVLLLTVMNPIYPITTVRSLAIVIYDDTGLAVHDDYKSCHAKSLFFLFIGCSLHHL